MTGITNNKVRALGPPPSWSSFKGISVIFDNPGDSLVAVGEGLVRLTCRTSSDPRLRFYSTLEDAIGRLNVNWLSAEFDFCPLPSHSYHVTVWDGINDDNLASIVDLHRPTIQEFLEALPRSLKEMPNELRFVEQGWLLINDYGPITFRFKKLTNWGNKVLVVQLEPSNANSSTSKLDSIRASRQDLYRRLRQEVGIGSFQKYSPHVSLGYFANLEGGAKASSFIDNWTQEFKYDIENITITFDSMSIYGFTDMVSFYKVLD